MYSAVRVNQFEMKDTCIEFVIVSRQGNNVKSTIFAKSSILDFSPGSEYVSGYISEYVSVFSIITFTLNQ